MARTPSTMPELGRPAALFELPDFNGDVASSRHLSQLGDG